MSTMTTPDWKYQALPDMTEEQYRHWQTLLEERTGNYFSWQHRSIVQHGLFQRMRQHGLENYDQYFRMISQPSAMREWSSLIERITVKETRFFRHQPSFQLLEGYLDNLLEAPITRPLELWSVGCSTGEETWSMAMVASGKLHATGRSQDIRNNFGITGTDISLQALQVARQGLYSHSRIASLPPKELSACFTEKDRYSWEIQPFLKERACFSRVNVLELARAPMRNMDVIFCQNLLIYFRRWRRIEIIKQLTERLVPGGILILGPGEITSWSHKNLVPVTHNQTLAFIKRP